MEFIAQRMVREEYISGPESNLINEYIDGIAYLAQSGNDAQHQLVLTGLLPPLWNLKKEGRLMIAPQDMYFGENILQPDIFWTRTGGDCRVVSGDCCMNGHREGVPDLIIEVLCPDTVARDRGRKYEIYELFGVPELWFVEYDPQRKVEIYAQDSMRLRLHGVYSPGETFVSPVLNQTIVVSEIYRDLF